MDSSRRARLRSIGHPMKALMRIGRQGMTEAFVAEFDRSLKAHQLLKVRLDTQGPEECRARAEELAAAVGAKLVDVVGSVALVYREDPDDPLVKV